MARLTLPQVLPQREHFGGPLTIETPDGDPNVGHPSWVRVPGGWNGYTDWLAFTPYPDASRENPCILASNDGRNWERPPGLTNPVFSLDDATALGYGHNSDTELVYDGANDRMLLYHRPAGGDSNEGIYRMTSVDGVTWGDNTECLTNDTGSRLLSPAVLIEDDGTYSMWVVNEADASAQGRQVDHYHSADGLTWTGPTTCSIPTGCNPWHIDVARAGGTYHMLVNTDTGLRLLHWTSVDGVTWRGSNRSAIETVTFGDRYYRSSLLVRSDTQPPRFDAMLNPRDAETPQNWRLALATNITLPEQAVLQRDVTIQKALRGEAPYVVADVFHRRDNASSLGTAPTGQTYTATGTSGTFGIKDKGAYAPSGNAVATVDSGLSDCFIELRIDTDPAYAFMPEAWIVFRYAGSSRLRFGTNGNGSADWAVLRLEKIDGSVTLLAAYANVQPGQRIGVRLEGSTIGVYLEGYKLGEVTDALNQLATVHGLQSNSADVRLREFLIRSL